MPKVPTTTTRRRSFSPSFPDRQLHKLFDDLFGTAHVRTENEPEIIDNASHRSQSSSTRRKRDVIFDLLKLGYKTKSGIPASSTQAKRNFIIDLLKPGKSEPTSNDSSSGSFSSDDEDAGLTGSNEEETAEEPIPPSIPVIPVGEPHTLLVASPPSGSSSDVAVQVATHEKVEAETEGKGVTLVDLDDEGITVEVPKNLASTTKKQSSNKGKQATNPDFVSVRATESDSTGHLVIPTIATTTAPSQASASDSSSVPAPAPAVGPLSLDPLIGTASTTASFPFNHFPSAPRLPAGPRRGLRREHGFYHKSHYEIAWVPEFGDRDAPPQTLEGVLPPWDPMFRATPTSAEDAGRSSRPVPQDTSPSALLPIALALPPQAGASSAPAAAYPSPVESSTSTPATGPRSDESVTVDARAGPSTGTRGAVSKRKREPEDENVEPAMAEERPVRRRRVAVKKAVGV